MNNLDSMSKLVPGFEFLQNLVKGAGAAIPSVGQWVAPTLDPAELDKRIQELRTVQFWLEQNARMLATTIQALEVQRMTLSTLQTMNVSFGDLTESLKVKVPEAASPAPAPAPSAPPTAPAAPPRAAKAPPPAAPSATPTAPGIIDPMQWWGALTQQFTELAASAINDTHAEAARNVAESMVRQGIATAGQALKTAGVPAAAAKVPAKPVKASAGVAAKRPAGKGGRAVRR